MKQGFDKIDVFTKALNIQAKLYCNVDNAYSLRLMRDFDIWSNK